MKTLIFKFILFVLTLFVVDGSTALLAQQADLRVTAILPQGGLTEGSGNRIRVNVANIGPRPARGQINVLITIIQGRSRQVKQKTINLLPPNDNNGQPVTFDNVTMKSRGPVRIKARINPRGRIAESNIHNNTMSRSFNVRAQPYTSADGAAITVQAYHKGTWGYQGPNTFKPVTGASILLQRNGANLASGATDASGRRRFTGMLPGTYTVRVSRPGFYTKVKTLVLGTSPKEANMEMRAGG